MIFRISVVCLAIAASLGSNGSARASDFYKWTDEDGVVHLANSLDEVPEKYRNQIEKLADSAAGSASTPPPVRADAAAGPAEDPGEFAGATGGLRRFEVRYQAYEGAARRVIIPVRFNDRVTAPMAVDTGSPGMVISLELAEQIGIFSRSQGLMFTEVAGIGGRQLGVKTIVDSVAVQDARDSFVPTTVTVGMSDAFQGLIGMDFLANYNLSIDGQRQVVVFQEVPPEGGARGGHDEAWWRRTFQEFREARDFWRERVEARDKRLTTKGAAFLEFQARESQRLLLRLDSYASQHAVPRHWR